MRALVTGGAGFVGSHITDALLARGHEVTVYDRLTTGTTKFLEVPLGLGGNPRNGHLSLVKGDILTRTLLSKTMRGHDTVFHVAANADVRGGVINREIDLEQNAVGTHSVLEAVRQNDVRRIVFTSSAVVYGEPTVIPTPEDYHGLQTSLYGASKLAAEALIEAYVHYYGIEAETFRFVSLIGERYTHGVVFDFVNKLKANPHTLEILGDGNQRKSYLHVVDAVSGILCAFDHHASDKGKVNVYNLGHTEAMDVKRLADVVCDEMGIRGVSYKFTGGTRGWLGDSPLVILDTHKIMGLGWRPSMTVEQGIRRTVRYLMDNPEMLVRRAKAA